MSFQNGAELQNSSVNNTATEPKQKSLAKPGFIAAIGDTSAQDSCSGIAKPIINIK